ncbi:MAG: tetratricopeptide repeat protein [Chitinivibrionales bacterium]
MKKLSQFKIPIGGVLLFLLMSVAAFTPASAQQCQSLLSQGDSLHQRYENKQALNKYQAAYEQCPQNYEALMKMTRVLNDVGEDIGGEQSASYYQQAIAYAETLQAKYPDSVQSYFLESAAAGNLALYRGGREKVKLSRAVINNTNKAIELDSSYSPAWVIKGAYYRQVATASSILKTFAQLFLGGLPDGTLEDSREALETAVRLDPRNDYAVFEMGKTLEAMGEEKRAADYFKKVLSLPDTHNQSDELKEQAREALAHL